MLFSNVCVYVCVCYIFAITKLNPNKDLNALVSKREYRSYERYNLSNDIFTYVKLNSYHYRRFIVTDSAIFLRHLICIMFDYGAREACV